MAFDFAFLEPNEELLNTGAAYQSHVYVVMRISPRLGGTYSEIRKSYQGALRLLKDWDTMGIDMNNVRVFPMEKAWIPVRKAKDKKNVAIKTTRTEKKEDIK